MMSKEFGPKNAEEERIYAEENFRIDVQMLIHDVMEKKGINQRELAQRLGVTEARVSQFFSDRFNMTVRKLAGVFYALGERPELKLAKREVLSPLVIKHEQVWSSTFNMGNAQADFTFKATLEVDCKVRSSELQIAAGVPVFDESITVAA